MAETAAGIKKILKKQMNVPIYIWGDPGIGKSDVVKQAGKELGVPVIDIRLSLMDPTDLRGIPMIIDGKAEWVKPSFLPNLPGTMMFFDELNHAAPSVQSAAYQIILDGRIGEHVLPENTIRLAAGNKKGAGMLAFDLPLPLKNRFVHLDMRHSKAGWLEWGEESGIDERILTFIRSKQDLLMEMPTDSAKISKIYGFPTPRSWAFTSEILSGCTFGADEDILRPCIDGAIGKSASATFLAYLQMLEEYHTPEEVLANPSLLTKDTNKSVMWSVLTSIAEIITKKDAKNFNTLLENPNIPAEVGAYVIRLALNKYGHWFIVEGDAIRKFINKEEVQLALDSSCN
jgi:hypothetical protein